MARDTKKEFREEIWLKIMALTKARRLFICILTLSFIGGTYYHFVFSSRNEKLKKREKEYKIQVHRFTAFKEKASELERYEKMKEGIESELKLAMKALPDRPELSSLLTGISESGLKSGLFFLLFQPGPEVRKEFYREIPVSIKAEGQYFQITDFFYRVSMLSRIVNIKDLQIQARKETPLVEMSCKAVTYMFVKPGSGNGD